MKAIVERPVQNDEGRLRYGIVTDENFRMQHTWPDPRSRSYGTEAGKAGYLLYGTADESGKLTRKPVRTRPRKFDPNKHESDTFEFKPDSLASRTFYADGRHVTWQAEFLFREDPRAICLEDGSIFVREDLVGSPQYLETLGGLAKAYADALKGGAQIPGIDCPEIPRDNGHGVLRLEAPI